MIDAGSKGRALRERADFSACVWGGGDDFLRAAVPFPLPAPRTVWAWARGDVDVAVRVADAEAAGAGKGDVVVAPRAGCECECECEYGWCEASETGRLGRTVAWA